MLFDLAQGTCNKHSERSRRVCSSWACQRMSFHSYPAPAICSRQAKERGARLPSFFIGADVRRPDCMAMLPADFPTRFRCFCLAPPAALVYINLSFQAGADQHLLLSARQHGMRTRVRGLQNAVTPFLFFNWRLQAGGCVPSGAGRAAVRKQRNQRWTKTWT